MTWTVPREWEGETAFLIGGGPSLTRFDAGVLKGRGRIIAINNAYQRAPFADVVYWADERWLTWAHAGILKIHKGRWKVTRSRPRVPLDFDVQQVAWAKDVALSRAPDRVAGWCSGGNSINLAALFGARRIVLLGFDMRPGHWHADHRHETPPGNYEKKFIPAIERMAPELAADGIDVINASPDSALTCFPHIPLERLL